MKVLVLHGPNLDLLGEREPEIYGTLTLAQLDEKLVVHGAARGIEVRTAQSNVEGALIDLLHEARTWADAVVFNPGGYSHTSVALRDAVAAIRVPVIEVHLSNPAAREEFRRTDIVATACTGVIAGFGWRSYVMALDALTELLAGP